MCSTVCQELFGNVAEKDIMSAIKYMPQRFEQVDVAISSKKI